MAGRKKTPGAEVRSESMHIRWTKSERERLEKAQKMLGITYLVDVPRILALRQLELIESAGRNVVAE